MITNKLPVTLFTTVILLTIVFDTILLYTCTSTPRTMKFYFDFHTFKYTRIALRGFYLFVTYFLEHQQKKLLLNIFI